MNTLDQKLQQLGVMMLVRVLLYDCAHRDDEIAIHTLTRCIAISSALEELNDKANELVTSLTNELQAMEPPRPLIAMLTSIDCPDPVQWAGWIHQELEARINDQVTTGRRNDSE